MGAKRVLYAAKIMTVEKPDKIILIAPSPPTVEAMPKLEKERMLQHPSLSEAIKTVEGATVKNMPKKSLKYAVASQLRIGETTRDWWLNEGMRNDIAARITDLDMPSYVIFSKHDPVIDPESIYTEVLPYLKNPALIVLGNVGHLIQMEAPRKLARQIKRITMMKKEGAVP